MTHTSRVVDNRIPICGYLIVHCARINLSVCQLKLLLSEKESVERFNNNKICTSSTRGRTWRVCTDLESCVFGGLAATEVGDNEGQ